MLGPLGADVFIGLSEEEQNRRHIANVEAPSDKDVNISSQCIAVQSIVLSNTCFQKLIICDDRLKALQASKGARMSWKQ